MQRGQAPPPVHMHARACLHPPTSSPLLLLLLLLPCSTGAPARTRELLAVVVAMRCCRCWRGAAQRGAKAEAREPAAPAFNDRCVSIVRGAHAPWDCA